MKTFSFITHPLNREQLHKFWPLSRLLPYSVSENVLPFKISKIIRISSNQGNQIQGYIIACPLLPEHFLRSEGNFVLDKIISAGRIAERLGSNILGLGGYTSAATDENRKIAKSLKIPVTSGSAFTSWSAFEAIYRMARFKKIDLNNSTLAISGASGAVGLLCAKKFSDYVHRIILTGSSLNKLEELRRNMADSAKAEVVLQEDERQAFKESDAVIITNGPNGKTAGNNVSFKEGSVVCHISYDASCPGIDNRNGVTFITGGLIGLPFQVDFGMHNGRLKSVISASIAETLLLTFEERFVNYSLGEGTNVDKMEEIADLGVNYGFEVWLPDVPVL